MNGERLIIFAFTLGGQVFSIGISSEDHAGKIGELNTQLDQPKIRYSPKGVKRKSSDMGQD